MEKTSKAKLRSRCSPSFVRFLVYIGRISLGGAFVFSGAQSLMDFAGFVKAIEANVPLGATLGTLQAALAIAAKMGGGLCLVVSKYVPLGAFLLFAFIFLATAFFHLDFDQPRQIISFKLNIMVMGGLLVVAAEALRGQG